MGNINVLDKNIAELIAAGEVVERPASVIKELVENSVDAGATAITIEIKNGGVKYIRISDNGSGILKEDVPKAFLRHATSKVATAFDLDSISTLGFRGEALASVCAVSRVQLLTKHKSEEIGTLYEISAGEEQLYDDAGCPQGTTIIVRDLFYNVPARMKFLKKDVAEGNAVANIIDKLALSHSEISITFIRDGKQVLKTPGDGNLKSAIYSVYGKEFVSKLLPVDYSLNGISVKGYITKPEFARPNRNMQNFFINGRFIKSVTAAKALEEAFKGSIMVGKIPSCVLHITIPCEVVDVNVHPAKTEVRFVNEKPIFDVVYHGSKTALLKGDTPKEISLKIEDIIPHKTPNPFSFEKSPYAKKSEPSTQLPLVGVQQYKAYEESKAIPEASVKSDSREVPITNTNKSQAIADEPQLFIPKAKPFVRTESILSSTVVRDTINEQPIIKASPTQKQAKECLEALDTLQVEVENTSENKPVIPEETITQSYDTDLTQTATNIPEKDEYTAVSVNIQNEPEPIAIIEEKPSEQLKYLGEAFYTYILVQKGDDKIIFIDKHAAHERIIYERLRKEKGKGYMQYLLAPAVVNLPKDEYNAIIENIDRLQEYNFEIDDFGNGNVAVRGVPQYVDNCDINDMIAEIANNLIEKKKDISTEQMEWIYHSISCRSAIKAGNINFEQELIELAKIVDTDENIRYCPHGRPVSFVLTKRELEKQFGRV
ncbi:MAG: DNA mismatch repair endonuclease MutL [Acutalibacteraceae bacterium]|nr:DNA mismatch repair endonuclease MutL [Acutalibacteraceae bacterium]